MAWQKYIKEYGSYAIATTTHKSRLAAALSISRGAYSNYENGIRTIPVEHLLTLSNLYGVSVDYILEKTENPLPYSQ